MKGHNMTATKKTATPVTPTETPASDDGPRPAAVTKIGNLTRDPELQFSSKGNAYCRFSIAVEKPGPSGGWSDKVVEFIDVTAFGETAEHAAESLEKGVRAIVVGTPEIREWADKDTGEKRTGKSIAANAVGPDLRFATCTVDRVTRTSPSKVADAEALVDF